MPLPLYQPPAPIPAFHRALPESQGNGPLWIAIAAGKGVLGSPP